MEQRLSSHLDTREDETYLKAFKLIVSVHNELRLVAVNTHQDHIFRISVHVAAHQFVGCPVSE